MWQCVIKCFFYQASTMTACTRPPCIPEHAKCKNADTQVTPWELLRRKQWQHLCLSLLYLYFWWEKTSQLLLLRWILRNTTFTLQQSQVYRPIPQAQHTQNSILCDWTEECRVLLNTLLPLTTEFTVCYNS